jgi:hypothetical protein
MMAYTSNLFWEEGEEVPEYNIFMSRRGKT